MVLFQVYVFHNVQGLNIPKQPNGPYKKINRLILHTSIGAKILVTEQH